MREFLLDETVELRYCIDSEPFELSTIDCFEDEEITRNIIDNPNLIEEE